MANTPVDLTDTTNPEDQGSQGTPPPAPAAATRGRSRSRRGPQPQPQPQPGASLEQLLQRALQQLEVSEQQQQRTQQQLERSEQREQRTQQQLERSEQREQQAQQAQQETQERLERGGQALVERLELQPQVQQEQKPPPPNAADLLWETLLEGGVGEGGDKRRSWDALGSKSHEFDGKLTTWTHDNMDLTTWT